MCVCVCVIAHAPACTVCEPLCMLFWSVCLSLPLSVFAFILSSRLSFVPPDAQIKAPSAPSSPSAVQSPVSVWPGDAHNTASHAFFAARNSAFNPFTASASKISGLKDARTRLQRVYFPGPTTHLLLMLSILMKSLSHASAKKKTKRLK